MPDWLSDPPQSSLIVLILLLIIAGALWYRTRAGWSVRLLVGSIALLILVTLMDQLITSPREESERRVRAMAAAFEKKDWSQFAENVSSKFDMRGKKKDDMRTPFQSATHLNVRVGVMNFDRQFVRNLPDDGIEIGFDARADAADGGFPVHVRAVFVRDPDGQHRLKTFALKDFVTKTNDFSMPIPGVP